MEKFKKGDNMEKENLNDVSALDTGDDTNNQYIQALNELKSKSVEKAEYDKLMAENKKLLDTIVNGREIDEPKQEEKKDINELRKTLFGNENLTNLQYVENALELREALIEKGEMDPFLPYGRKIAPTDEDVSTAQKVADILKECVSIADGDSSIFTNELQRRTIDVGINKKR